jgi:hypothetical protein
VFPLLEILLFLLVELFEYFAKEQRLLAYKFEVVEEDLQGGGDFEGCEPAELGVGVLLLFVEGDEEGEQVVEGGFIVSFWFYIHVFEGNGAQGAVQLAL